MNNITKPRATVLTLALGRRFYLDLAVNLARSFLRFHRTVDIAFYIITDRQDTLPDDLYGCKKVLVEPGQFGVGFSPKLHLDHLSPGGPTLFLDSDILIYEPLDRLLTALAGRAVATVGTTITQGEWFGDISAYCAQLGVSSIPKFNGGLYYLEPGDCATAVYVTARSLAERYDELGLVRLRGHANDELVMAGAMALNNLCALEDDGSFMSDPQACPGPLHLNVLTGRRSLTNPPPPSRMNQAWNPFHCQSPALVHFLGEHALRPQYRAEAQRLRLAAFGYPPNLANLLANVRSLWPGQIKDQAKATLRPLFHLLFGHRKTRKSPRE
jgi:hypothetical protein